MANMPIESKQYMNEEEALTRFYQYTAPVVQKLLESWNTNVCFSHVGSRSIPSQESIVRIIHQARRILFPGYFTQTRLDPANLEYWLSQKTAELHANLSKQIFLSIQHDYIRSDQSYPQGYDFGHETAIQFILALPEIKKVLDTDIRAALEGDPAAKSYDEVIFSYPGFFAITVYRMAHKLYELDVPLLPRIMTEYSHSFTGIDIHPAAKIGESFFIDHGTGVVVGETTEIGDRVRLYQGVTLGALSLPRETVNYFRNKKRHPTIGDDVIIYSNATILGDPVIGARSIIGGNVWITESVPPDTKVLLKRPELIYKGNNNKAGKIQDQGG